MYHILDVLFIVKQPKWIGVSLGVFWSLQLELWYYLFSALLIKLFNSRYLIIISLFLILVSLLFKFILLYNHGEQPIYSIIRMFFWIDNFLYGSIASILLSDIGFLRKFKFGLRFSSICILIFCYIIFKIGLIGVGGGLYWPLESSFVSFITSIIIFVALSSSYSAQFFLYDFKFFSIFKVISIYAYVIYLCHGIALDFNVLFHFSFISPFLLQLILLSLSVFLAVFMHVCIEKPGIQFGRMLSNRFN